MKYCIFCGEEIQNNAIFCPNCGAKLPEEKKTNVQSENNEDEENNDEDSIELSILSKVNFESREKPTKSIIPAPSVKKVKKIPQDNIEQNIEQKESSSKIIQYVKKQSQQEQLQTKEPELLETHSDEENQQENTQEQMQEDTAVNDEIARMFENLDDVMNDKVITTPSIMQDIISDAVENMETETINTENENDKKNTNEQQNKKVSSKPTRAKVTYQKRNISADSEDEEDEQIIANTKMRKNSSFNLNSIDDDLTADEIADREKYKKIKIEEEKKEKTSSKKGEGRKNNGRKKEARKNVDKEIAQRKINVIEHEEINKKDDVDPDYDGYYENVKPIDFDKQKDNSSLIKVIITAVSFAIVATIIFYFLITFFLQ